MVAFTFKWKSPRVEKLTDYGAAGVDHLHRP